MSRAYLSLGSNLGPRLKNLSGARRRLRESGVRIVRQSHVIETEPWGVVTQPRYLNQVLEVDWLGTARELLRVAKDVERAGGRRKTYRWGPRVIDVDILMFDEARIATRDLVVPHPRINEREFVLAGLRELGAPGIPLPRSGRGSG